MEFGKDSDEVYWTPGEEADSTPEDYQTPQEDMLTSDEEYNTPRQTPHKELEASHDECETSHEDFETTVEDCDTEDYETAFEVGVHTAHSVQDSNYSPREPCLHSVLACLAFTFV